MAMATATPISTPRWDGPAPPVSFTVSFIPASLTAVAICRRSVRLGEEAGFFHQAFMQFFGIGDPFRIVVAGHEGLVEGSVVHQLLPLGRFAHFLEQVNIVGDLIFRYARRHEVTAQHEILDVKALRLAGWNIIP